MHLNKNRNRREQNMSFKLAPGDKPLNGYTIRRGLGIGGFGEVYFAVSDSGKEVALKRIHRNLEVEVRGASHCLNLRHPNLVGLFDIRQEDADQGWIVMEYIAGENLKDRLDQQPHGLPIKDVLSFFGQMSAGVQYLHDQGIVHRDLKPANIFIENSLIKIGDYGLSKFISASRRGGQTESVGTFHYMAPEIGKGEYGREIDIYSLGIMLYEMLTGKVPFDGESSQEIILKHLTADPDVSMLASPYREVIMKALAKDPVQRFSSVASMLEPLGLAINESGMAVSLNQTPTVKAIPVLNSAQQTGTLVHTVANTELNRVLPRRYYREPIANEVANLLNEIQNQFNRIPYGSPGYAFTLISFILLLVFFGPAFVPLLVFIGFCYLPYYVVWYVLFSHLSPPATSNAIAFRPNHQHHVQTKPIVASRPVLRMRPVSFQEWQSRQRSVLAKKPFASRWSEWTGSSILASAILAVLSLAGYLFTLATNHAWTGSSDFIAIGTWTSVMTLLTTWTILFFAKRWENRPEDSLIYRFIMMSSGLALGGIGWGLSYFLMVPWDSINLFQTVPRAVEWPGFYHGLTPQWPVFVAYFGLILGSVRWWRQADVLRKNRFSVFSILWSVLMAAFVCCLVNFPMPWCLIVAGATSALTQMATRNHDVKNRPRFVEVLSSEEVGI